MRIPVEGHMRSSSISYIPGWLILLRSYQAPKRIYWLKVIYKIVNTKMYRRVLLLVKIYSRGCVIFITKQKCYDFKHLYTKYKNNSSLPIFISYKLSLHQAILRNKTLH